MPARKTFIFYLIDTGSGKAWYKDASGNILKGSIMSGTDISLKHAPKGWETASLEYGRNSTYWGLNQQSSNKFTFVLDGADILRYLYYTQSGIEQPLTLVVYKWNSNPAIGEPNYKLFCKQILDLPHLIDRVAEGVDVPLVQGGAPALLKAFENTIFQIPMDGSIPQNFKINMDGYYLPDTLYYSFVKFNDILGAGGGVPVIPPMIYNGHDGDNFGIANGTPSYESTIGAANFSNYMKTSANWIFQSQNPITINVSGSITVQPYLASENVRFFLFLATNLSELIPGGPASITNAKQLVPSGDISTGIKNIEFYGARTFYFNQTMTLTALQTVFLVLGGLESNHGPNILGGSLQISFFSKPQNTRVWAITKYDAGKILMNDINLAASTTNQTFGYGFDSMLLSQNLGYALTSGDALRASGDPNYPKFYNAVTINPNVNSQVIANVYGPVMKLAVRQLFEDCHVVHFACLGNQQLPGENESIFIEDMGYVFDDSVDTMDLGEVADFSVGIYEDVFFNQLNIGYHPQQYDQKQGKFEPNTTLEMASPLKSIISKKIEKISPIRYDTTYFERARANIAETSITKNDGDSSVCCIRVDFTKWILDYFRASFNMGPTPGTFGPNNTDFTDVNNQNIALIPDLNVQGIPLSMFDGSYLSINNDPSIFILNQPGTATRALNFSLSVTLLGSPFNSITGTPADTVTVYLYKNGAILQQWTITSSAANYGIAQTLTYSGSSTYSFKDCMYVRATTSTGATATINPNAIFTLDVSYFSVSIDAPVLVPAGSYLQLIPFTNTSAISTVNINGVNYPIASFGFQYFVFNESLPSNGFDYLMNVQGIMDGNSSMDCNVILWYNGFPLQGSLTNGNGTLLPFIATVSGPIVMSLGDIVFITADTTNQHVQITEADLTFTSKTIKAYSLYRVQYDSLAGIPNLAVNPITGLPDTTQPGAPYNIEGITPKRLFYKHGALVRSPLYNQIPGAVSFSTLSKNQYLKTQYNGQVYVENANEEISNLNEPLFYPLIFKFKTKVGWNFADLMAQSENAHIHFTYNNQDFYGFAKSVKQELPLNPMETWELIASPKNDLSQLTDLNITGLNFIP